MENKNEKLENFTPSFEKGESRESIEKKSFEEKADYTKAEEDLSSLFQKEKKEGETAPIKELDQGVQRIIEDLLVLAFKEGEDAAVKKAQSFSDPFIVDTFHDRLTEEIKKRKI
ncbi:MAG: hypothetical protein PHG24_01160 [Candidatus Pacebacteria bacterium]|nr:hypothetical protein [Candidatus Paceibacterota bacterium]